MKHILLTLIVVIFTTFFVNASTTSVSVLNASTTSVSIGWEPVSTAGISYKVRFVSQTTGMTNLANAGSSTNFTIDSLTYGDKYNIYVSTTLGTNESALSDVISWKVGNHFPSLTNQSAGTISGSNLVMSVAKLLTKATDVDGDTLSINTGTFLSTNNRTFVITNGNIIYNTPTTSGKDKLVLTLNDGNGGLTPVDLVISITNNYIVYPGCIVKIGTVYYFQTNVYGIPNTAYTVEHQTNSVGNWLKLSNYVASSTGVILVREAKLSWASNMLYRIASTYVPNPTNTTPTIPLAPTNLVFVSSTTTTATMKWTDTSNNETGFTVQTSLDGSTGWTAWEGAALPANTTTYTDSLPKAGTYYYRVQSYNANGRSGWSNVLKITTK